jgi:MHS family proline/betaine transporter-like MFS transporter
MGIYLRRTLAETPAFIAESRRPRGAGASPEAGALRERLGAFICAFGISILWAVAVYVLLLFMPVYVQKAFGFTATQAFGASLIENILFVCGCFTFGAAADRIGLARMSSLGAVALLIAVLPLFLLLDAHRSTAMLVAVLAAFGVLVASFTSVAPAVLAGLFPTGFRATGVSLAYNGAFTIFGGFAPAILTWFTAVASGSVLAPAWYVTAAAMPAIAATAYLGRRAAPVPAPRAGAVAAPVRDG